ncbi:carnitine dehydratase [Anoxybacter fermentans]|uniref:Carnitine dehydratase n=1 Tax=Anoxybacter fermentans TaxID=1323375 RepID=A0A3S9SWK9_9FIRM|nr:CoA transferase [Anoxybacter fermentans]AZR72679.1 carnitine dehydratase [Anoxybacter fermentans]
MTNNKPLKDVIVLDLTRVLAGPYCTMILADLGAEVIKVERPGVGDDSRAFGPFINGKSAYFISLNRGKKSIVLNLKDEKDREIFKQLVKKVDVLTENFRPGTMEKLGFGYEELKKINPRLIYAATSGFGHTGPKSKKAAYDMIVQAAGGIMSITGHPGGPPTRVGASIGDIIAGLFTAIGVCAALYQREKTGKGQKIDVAMLDSQVAILENAIARYIVTGEPPKPLGARHPSITPFEAFKAADDWVIIAIGNDALWAKFCKAVGREDLIDHPEFATNAKRTENYDKLKPIMDEIISKKTAAEWIEELDKAGIPVGPINTIDKLFEDPQIKARNMLVDVNDPEIGKMKVAGNPIKMSSFEDEKDRQPAPNLGEHTEEILKRFLG